VSGEAEDNGILLVRLISLLFCVVTLSMNHNKGKVFGLKKKKKKKKTVG
jgi:hypothetical protein